MDLALIAFLVAVALVGWLAVQRLTHAPERARRLAQPARTMAEYRTQQEISDTGPGVLPEWVDCPCCGYPALDRGSDSFAVCQICDWEDDASAGPEPISRARESFRRFGTSYSPEEAAEWGALPPREEVVEARREFMAACDAVRAGEMDFAAWWRRVSALLDVLGSRS